MKKKLVVALLLVVSIFVNAKVDMGKVNSRILEMKMDLKKDLHKKKYGNEVKGSYEIEGNKIKLKAYMVPIAERARQKEYNLIEVRDLNDFENILKVKGYLPKYVIDEAKPLHLKEIFGGGILLLMGLLMGVRHNNLKRRRMKNQKRIKTEETIDIKKVA